MALEARRQNFADFISFGRLRQRQLMAKYEQNDDVARLSDARRVLERMQKHLAQMTAAHVAAEEHLSKLTVDEASVEKVVRDSPM